MTTPPQRPEPRSLLARWRRDRVRWLQVGFLCVMTLAAAQVLWWMIDQGHFAAEMENRLLEVYRQDVEAARRLLAAGEPTATVERRWPHVEVGDGDARLRDAAVERLRAERRRHLNQYLWEGAFFLLVLLAAMSVVWRVLRQEARLQRRQQNFLAAVSHELRSPIASLQLATETMARRDLDTAQRTRLLANNLEDLRRLDALISNLLDTNRLEEGRVTLRREDLDLRAAVDEVLRDMSRGAAGAERELVNEVPEGLVVEADPVALATVLRNLVDNALKATGAGGRVVIEGRADEGGTMLAVTDDGEGFAPEEGERLFEKFYRPGDELRRRTRGTGLGLYLVRGYVALEGGTVRATSAGPGRGARFEVTWPGRGRLAS
ncbi:MAG TPA: HAMP domain-containing sensor histidine kinase [Thermoanaerobaculia bacterium]|nr:HAMP domain-containing sensor histidine kinase [Thermoanaerobaculia bacterium]